MVQGKLRQQSFPQSLRIKTWLLSAGMTISSFLLARGAMEQADSAFDAAVNFRSLATSTSGLEGYSRLSRTYSRLEPPTFRGDGLLKKESLLSWEKERASVIAPKETSIDYPFGGVSGPLSLDTEKRPARVWSPKSSAQRITHRVMSALQDTFSAMSKPRYGGRKSPLGPNPNWKPVMVIDSPEAAQRYVKNFDPEMFKRYIKRLSLSPKGQSFVPMYQLTIASENHYTIGEIITRILLLQPFEAGNHAFSLSVSRARQAANPGSVNFDDTQEAIRIQKILTDLIPSYLRPPYDESKSYQKEWKFYQALENRLEDSELIKYDHMAIYSFVHSIYQRAKPQTVWLDDLLDNHIEQSIPEILAARLHNPYEKSNLPFDENLYIRHALGSMHTFILRHPRPTRSQLSIPIRRFYKLVSLRHSNSPDIVWLVKTLQDHYASLFSSNELTRGGANFLPELDL
ncbi:hypothetical protein DFH28DRAFT_1117572 [Melampsora americana]|nr:hypothetical protein DFH28DRAFT_1117572 [Melampsora americana]